MIIFGSVQFLSKKNNQTEFKKKKNRNRFKPVWLGFSVLARFSRFWLSFSGLTRLAWFFSSLPRFFPVFFGLGSIRFGFLLIKSNRTGLFFQNFNRFDRFFFQFLFFRLFFFPVFSIILLTPNLNHGFDKIS